MAERSKVHQSVIVGSMFQSMIYSLPYGNSCIEAKPQPEITPNGSFDENFPSHYAIDGNGSFS